MIREVHVEVGADPAHESLGLQGGAVQGLLDKRMNQDVAGYLIIWIWSSRQLWSATLWAVRPYG